MMKRLIANFAVVAILAVVATGCVSVETNRAGAALDFKCEQKFQPTVRLHEVPIEAEANVNCLFNIFTWGVNKTCVGMPFVLNQTPTLTSFLPNPAETAKLGAVYNACVKNNADFLAQPRYILTTEDYFIFKKINCKVIGYPGQVLKLTPVK